MNRTVTKKLPSLRLSPNLILLHHRPLTTTTPSTTPNPTASTTSTSPPPPQPPPQPQSQPQSQSSPPNPSPKDPLALPYHVYRTASAQLPIYQSAKRGGNLHQTKIQRIRGDARALRDDLVRELNLGAAAAAAKKNPSHAGKIKGPSPMRKKTPDAIVNPITGHVILKGWWKSEVKRFLEARRF